MNFNFDTKYSIGDVVKRKVSRLALVDCPICKKTGKITMRGQTLTCPNCNGRTQIYIAKSWIEEEEITDITCTVHYDTVHKKIQIRDVYYGFPTDNGGEEVREDQIIEES